MKKLSVVMILITGLVLVIVGLKTYRNARVIEDVTELKTKHFLISYQGIYPQEAQALADTLEFNYDRIRTDLRDPEHDVIHVYIHPDQDNFNKKTGLNGSHATGTSRGPDEFHVRWTNWLNSIFPEDPLKTAVHEFTHCIQLNVLIRKEQQLFVPDGTKDFNSYFEEKFANEYPQWFWEALCDYEAGIVNGISVRYGMRQNTTLKSLNSDNNVYNVGYTIIEYVAEKWGKEKFPELITTYVDIPKVLGVSEQEFEKGWIEFVEDRY